VVVAGGINHDGVHEIVEIYSVEQNKWRSANPLPHIIFGATVVPFGDSFFIVGGTDRAINYSTIYRYNPEEDSWTLMDGRMRKGQFYVISMLVKREIFEQYSLLMQTDSDDQ
jgi:N-acetylneuraminic acid mutarotase